MSFPKSSLIILKQFFGLHLNNTINNTVNLFTIKFVKYVFSVFYIVNIRDIMASSDATNNDLLDSPIRGPTLSTSTSSFEALDPHDPNLSRLATKMFSKTEDYITNELNAPLEDYKLLEDMNKATIAKYSDMRQIAENLSVSTNELSFKFQQLIPLMQQIDEISDTVDKLEAAAYKLDAYSIALENRVRSVLQRKTPTVTQEL